MHQINSRILGLRQSIKSIFSLIKEITHRGFQPIAHPFKSTTLSSLFGLSAIHLNA